jgi:hypothetical protein
MQKSLRFLVPAILLVTPLRSVGRDLVIPAGALFQCTISDPNFSSKTAELNDPLLCEVRSTRWMLPPGTYLVGRLEEYRDPGHFVGKGWMYLSFDRMVLSDRVVPLTGKIVQVPNLPVDRNGRIRGRGHPVRDAVEWSIPVLWPMKVITLPMRGPRPALKSESRLMLKFMEDVIVPDAPLTNNFRASTSTSWADRFWRRENAPLEDSLPQLGISPSKLEIPATTRESRAAALTPIEQVKGDNRMTALITKDGAIELASSYWTDDGERVRFKSIDGADKAIALPDLDYAKTVQFNHERGVAFAIRHKKELDE